MTNPVHVFICTNERAEGESCGAKGSAALRDQLKTKSKTDSAWKGNVRVTACGCLGKCQEGIAAVLYPQGQWFTKLSKTDEALLSTAIHRVLPTPPKQEA